MYMYFQTYQEFMKMYMQKTNDSRRTGYQEAPYGYDSAWAVAHMLNRSLTVLKRSGKFCLFVTILIVKPKPVAYFCLKIPLAALVETHVTASRA